ATAALLIVARPQSWPTFIVGIGLVSIIWLANYAEPMVAVLQVVPTTARGNLAGGARVLVDWLQVRLGRSFHHVIDLNQGLLPFLAPAGLGMAMALGARHSCAIIVAAVPFVLVLLSDLPKTVPWQKIGLGFLSTYRWYFEYGADSIAIL